MTKSNIIEFKSLGEAHKKAQHLLGAVLVKIHDEGWSLCFGYEVKALTVNRTAPYEIHCGFNVPGKPANNLLDRSALFVGNPFSVNRFRKLYKHDLYILNRCPRKKKFLGKSESEIATILNEG